MEVNEYLFTYCYLVLHWLLCLQCVNLPKSIYICITSIFVKKCKRPPLSNFRINCKGPCMCAYSENYGNNLLQHNSKWQWMAECSDAFQQAKNTLTTSQVLVHYDLISPLPPAGDASAYGIGAVISHMVPDRSERPIAFASKTLS